MYSQLTSSKKSAYDSCCRTSAYNNIIKKKNWFTCELRKIKKEILELICKKNNINHLNNFFFLRVASTLLLQIMTPILFNK
jgi:hypothetical protein